MTLPDASAVYGVIEIPIPLKGKNHFPEWATSRSRLIGAGIDLIVDLHMHCRMEAEFDLSPEEDQLRVYYKSTDQQLYQARIALQDGEPVIKVEPLTALALSYLPRLDLFLEVIGIDE